MTAAPKSLQQVLDRTRGFGPIRIAVACAAQDVIIETIRDARGLGLIEPRLVGDRDAIRHAAAEVGWRLLNDWIIPAGSNETPLRKRSPLSATAGQTPL